MDFVEEQNHTGKDENFLSNYNSTNGTEYNISTQSWNQENSMSSLSLNIALVYKLFILVFGLAGNITTIFIMRRTRAPITTRIILILLAISDSAHLIMNTPVIIALNFFGKTFSALSVGTCKLAVFSFFFFPSISAWLVAILTIERCFAVLIPLSVKRVATKERLIVFLLIFVSFYLGWDTSYCFNWKYYHFLSDRCKKTKLCFIWSF